MIGHKLQQAYYVVNLRGDAVRTFFDGDFGIDSIMIASDLFGSDIEASVAMMDVTESIICDPEVDFSEATQEFSLNPEFFPSLEPIIPTDDQTESKELLIDKLIAQHKLQDGQIPVVVTSLFDQLGDFIIARWQIEKESLSVISRVGLMPTTYMQLKSSSDDDAMLKPHRELNRQIHLQ